MGLRLKTQATRDFYNIFYRKEKSKANHARECRDYVNVTREIPRLLIGHEKRGNYQFADFVTLQ